MSAEIQWSCDLCGLVYYVAPRAGGSVAWQSPPNWVIVAHNDEFINVKCPECSRT